MIKNIFVMLLVACLSVVSGCATVGSQTKMISQENTNPKTQKIVVASEESLLRCFAQQPWYVNMQPGQVVDPQVYIKVVNIIDVSGKATYGDNGTGAIAPQESSSTAMDALGMAQGGSSPLGWLDGSDAMMATLNNEMKLGTRTVADNQQIPGVDYYLFGNLVTVDSVVAAVQQVIVYGVGGGPRQERWSFDMNLRLVKNNTVGYRSTGMFNQYVQQEMKGVVSSVVGGGSGKTLLTVDIENVVRGKLQGLMRPMIFVGVADLLSTLPGAPSACVKDVKNFLNTKSRSKPYITAWNHRFPAANMNMSQREETAMAA